MSMATPGKFNSAILSDKLVNSTSMLSYTYSRRLLDDAKLNKLKTLIQQRVDNSMQLKIRVIPIEVFEIDITQS